MYPSSPRRSRSGAAATRITAAIAITGAIAVPASAVSAATTSDTSPPRVEDIRFSRTAVAVSGLAVVPVTVSVRLTDASGVAETATGMTPSPQLTLGPVPGFRSRLAPVLTRTAGTATDGVWSATVHVPSTWRTVRVTSVDATDRAGNVLSGKPARSPALRVTGRHRPALTFRLTPLPGGGFRVHGRAYHTDTGRPIPRLPLAALFDSNCDMAGRTVPNIVTDARGRYEKRWPAGGPGDAGCVALTGPAAPGQLPALLAYHVGKAPLRSIPDEAMLQPEDLRGATPEPATDHWADLRPPQPCTDRPYPGTGLLRADRAVQALIGVGDRPTVVMAHVATYRGNGADRYLTELRRALAACAEPGPLDERWAVLATGVAGDESMLLERREYIDFAETWKSTYVMVARAGRVLVVVADAGWETASGHRDLVRELGTRAVSRADVLNRR